MTQYNSATGRAIITAQQVREMREKCQCGIFEAKSALMASDGDMAEAENRLRFGGMGDNDFPNHLALRVLALEHRLDMLINPDGLQSETASGRTIMEQLDWLGAAGSSEREAAGEIRSYLTALEAAAIRVTDYSYEDDDEDVQRDVAALRSLLNGDT
jgi:hypothetical protein